MLNAMVSAPGFALASRMAWRSDPAPASAVDVTVNVAARAAQTTRKAASAAQRLFIPFLLRQGSGINYGN